MKPIHMLLLAGCVLAFCVGAVAARAADYSIGAIRVGEPWTRVTPDGAKVAGGFMTITNTGAVPDTLIGGTAVVAGRIEVHEMSVQDGVMRMRELKPGLVIKPGETVALKPGSFHVMMFDLKAPLAAGQPVAGTLVFEQAGTIEIKYDVEPLGTSAKGDGGKPVPNAGAGHGMKH